MSEVMFVGVWSRFTRPRGGIMDTEELPATTPAYKLLDSRATICYHQL